MKKKMKKMKMEKKSLQAPWKEGDRETSACLYRRQTSNMYRLQIKKAMARLKKVKKVTSTECDVNSSQ